MRKPAFLFATAAVAWGAGFFAWALLGTAYSNAIHWLGPATRSRSPSSSQQGPSRPDSERSGCAALSGL
jgi:hypothetical protein